ETQCILVTEEKQALADKSKLRNLIVSIDNLEPWCGRAFQLVEPRDIQRDFGADTVINEPKGIWRTGCGVDMWRVNLGKLETRRYIKTEQRLILLWIGSQYVQVCTAFELGLRSRHAGGSNRPPRVEKRHATRVPH